MKFVKELFSRYGILLILILLFIVFSIASPAFLQPTNLLNISRQIATLGIASVGMTFVILTAGIDLSVGSNIALVSIVSAMSMANWGWGTVPAVILGIAVAALVGVFNGICVTRFRIPPLITTLAMMTSIRGLVYIISGGLPIFGFPESFNFIGRGVVLGVPFPVYVMVIVFVVGWVVMNKTRYGKYLYAIGGNSEAARLSGINVRKNVFLTYVYSGMLAGIGGIVLLSRANSGQPTAATAFEMDVITAVVIGGISISGGEGRYTGVIFGVLIIGILRNGLVLMNVDAFYQQFISGLVLLLAVGIDQYTKYRSNLTKVQELAIGAKKLE